MAAPGTNCRAMIEARIRRQPAVWAPLTPSPRTIPARMVAHTGSSVPVTMAEVAPM